MANLCDINDFFELQLTPSETEWQDIFEDMVSAIIMQVAGGSPKETYDTIDDLKAAEPEESAPENGYTGTRLVLTNADGKAHWFYYKNALRQWLDGNVYIAANLDDYCKTNGFYALLGAGYAAQLLSPKGNVISKDTFISRETYNGSSFGEGAAVLRKIEGKTEKSTSVLKLNDTEKTWQGLHYVVKDNIIKFDGNVSTNNLSISIDVGNVPPTPFTFYIDGEWVNNVNNIQIIKDSSASVSKVLNSSIKSTLVDFTPIKIKIFFGVGTFNGEFKIMSVAGTPDVLPPYEPYYTGLRSAKPTKLISKNAEGTKTSEIEIAPEIQALEGYGLSVGDVRNEVDLVNKKFIQRVSKLITLNGSEKWRVDGSKYMYRYAMDIPNAKDNGNAIVSSQRFGKNLYGGGYPSQVEGFNLELSTTEIGSKIAFSVKDISTIEEWKLYLQANPIQLVYEYATPEIIDLPVEQDDKFVAYPNGTERWEGTQVPVPTEIGYLPDLINKLWDLLTAAQQKAIDDKQDERLTALENRINQLEARVTALEPAPTFDEEVK